MSLLPKFATLSSGITNNYLYVADLNAERICKLKLNRDCHPFFIDSILGDPPGPEGPLIASHRRLRDAKKYFRNYLAKTGGERPDDSSEASWLISLYDKVTHRLRMSLYTVLIISSESSSNSLTRTTIGTTDQG
jgi:hypothetical protein